MNNLLDVLLDENNCDPIVLSDDEKNITFEQVAVIPFNNNIYCILKPLEVMEGVQEDEAIVFYVDEVDDTLILKVETDELTSLRVFEKYYDLLDENIGTED